MEPYWSEDPVRLWLGDCVDVLAGMAAGSVDAVVTDPPYGLEFMGREWDAPWRDDPDIGREWQDGMAAVEMADGARRLPRPAFERRSNVKCRNCGCWRLSSNPCRCANPDFPNLTAANLRAFQAWCERWAAECLRVLKPGGHLLAFGGTRTYHRLTCAIEDAGFEIRDSLHWIYGSGFPKSLDVSKAIDGHLTKGRSDSMALAEVNAERPGEATVRPASQNGWKGFVGGENEGPREKRAAPTTEDAARWDGWGTALKPSHEPIVVARKPLGGTVAANVLEHGTGALNVDGCRVGTSGSEIHSTYGKHPSGIYGDYVGVDPLARDQGQGRWPPNVLLTHSAACQPVGTRQVKASAPASGPTLTGPSTSTSRGKFNGVTATPSYGGPDGTETVVAWDCAPDCPVAELDRQSGTLKSPKPYEYAGKPETERAAYSRGLGYGWHDTERGDAGGASRFFPAFRYQAKAPTSERPRLPDGTAWPTVKPVDLMRWLTRLVTPPGGLVLDPFAGTGTTAEAAIIEGFRCDLIDKDPGAVALLRQRLAKPIQPTLG